MPPIPTSQTLTPRLTVRDKLTPLHCRHRDRQTLPCRRPHSRTPCSMGTTVCPAGSYRNIPVYVYQLGCQCTTNSNCNPLHRVSLKPFKPPMSPRETAKRQPHVGANRRQTTQTWRKIATVSHYPIGIKQ